MSALTLTDFLRARLREDERWAILARDDLLGPGWDGIDWQPIDVGALHHVRHHDPARVLAEVDAKRRILDEAANYVPELEHGDNGEWAFDITLRLLALPYAQHPDYRQEWKP